MDGTGIKKGLLQGGAMAGLPLAFALMGQGAPQLARQGDERAVHGAMMEIKPRHHTAPPPPFPQAGQQMELKPSATTTTAFNRSVEIKPPPPRSHRIGDYSAERDTYDRFLQHLMEREGYRNKVYRCSEGHPTVGVGHLVKACDGLKVGDVISDDHVKKLLREDAQKAFNAAREQAAELGISDPDFMIALGSVNFQLGTGWRSKFSKTWQLMKDGKFEEAAQRLNNTKWNMQTPVRVQDFQEALRAVGQKYSFHVDNSYRESLLGYAFNGAAVHDPFAIDDEPDVKAVKLEVQPTNDAAVMGLVA